MKDGLIYILAIFMLVGGFGVFGWGASEFRPIPHIWAVVLGPLLIFFGGIILGAKFRGR